MWLGPQSPPFQGGVARSAGVVSKKSRSHLILFEITNHPVCAAKERDLFIEAQPPLLEKEGNGLGSNDFPPNQRYLG